MMRGMADCRSRPPVAWHAGSSVRMLLMWLLLAPVTGALAGLESRKDLQAGFPELAGELSGWIARETGYLEPALPAIELETQAGLEALCFPGFSHDLLPRIRGAYDARSVVIYLNTDFESDSVLDRSYLLHELVHHFQVTNRPHESRRSKPAMEAEAIRIQLMWLEENGVSDPMTDLGVDENSLRRLEASPR